MTMQATFVEFPAFERHRAEYLDDDEFRQLQDALIGNPQAGALIEGSGGLRKLRYADKRRGKGRRGGLRVIYYWWFKGREFWLFTLYSKDEMSDLSAAQRAALKDMMKRELKARSWT